MTQGMFKRNTLKNIIYEILENILNFEDVVKYLIK